LLDPQDGRRVRAFGGELGGRGLDDRARLSDAGEGHAPELDHRRDRLGHLIDVRIAYERAPARSHLHVIEPARLALSAGVALSDVDEDSRSEVHARRLLSDPGVVLVRDLGLDVPVEAMALAGHHVHGLIGHVPVLRAFATRRDLLLVDVHAVRAYVRLLGRRDDADAPIARALPPRVALPDDFLLLGRACGPELRPVLARAEALRLEGTAPALLPEAHRHPVRLRLHDEGERTHVLVRVVVLVHAVG